MESNLDLKVHEFVLENGEYPKEIYANSSTVKGLVEFYFKAVGQNVNFTGGIISALKGIPFRYDETLHDGEYRLV